MPSHRLTGNSQQARDAPVCEDLAGGAAAPHRCVVRRVSAGAVRCAGPVHLRDPARSQAGRARPAQLRAARGQPDSQPNDAEPVAVLPLSQDVLSRRTAAPAAVTDYDTEPDAEPDPEPDAEPDAAASAATGRVSSVVEALVLAASAPHYWRPVRTAGAAACPRRTVVPLLSCRAGAGCAMAGTALSKFDHRHLRVRLVGRS
jgi:hypothetical protein